MERRSARGHHGQSTPPAHGPRPYRCAFPGAAAAVRLVGALLLAVPRAGAAGVVLGWNNLGMHCLDRDFSVFAILPPYNTIHAQVIDGSGHLLTDAAGIGVTYQAVADPAGSINTTSIGKTNFWDYVQPLFGAALPPDTGLPVPGPDSFLMPGAANTPRALAFEAAVPWFAAYGIPIVPRDDAGSANSYPLMRLLARQNGTLLASTDIVLPVSDEMDCRVCHGSGASPAARPAAGWENNGTDLDRDYRLNILRLHDEYQAGNPAYAPALASNAYAAAGLYATVVSGATPILCAACHRSEALPGSGLAGVRALTQAVHGRHASVLDPTNHLTLDASANRSACYRCHPGTTTRCLRGAMGKAVAADGSMLMQCQSCHGSLGQVGAATRTGWLDEPTCQSCHTGNALQNNGQIRYPSSFTAPGTPRLPVSQVFATNADTPAAGLSLYRFSKGHGNLQCAACHGSTHAEFPSSHRNDNLASIQHQGHEGMLAECGSCHGTVPTTVTGGPHGLHPLGLAWVEAHADAAEGGGVGPCRACHGIDYRGTVLSRAQGNRTVMAFGTKSFWRGFQIGCYACHQGPGSEDANPNHAPVASSVSLGTALNTPVAVPLHAADVDGDALALRIVSQAEHGSVGLSGITATYYPDPDYAGSDRFTFAAGDGQTDSNLGTVSLTVASPEPCVYGIDPLHQAFAAAGGAGQVTVNTARTCAWTATSHAPWIHITGAATGSGPGAVNYGIDANALPVARFGTLTVADLTFTVTQAPASTLADLTGAWLSLTSASRSAPFRGRLGGSFVIQNPSAAAIPRTLLAVYLSSTPSPAGATLLRTFRISALRPGRNVTLRVSISLPAGVSVAGKYVIAVVDAGHVVPGDTTGNNTIPYGPLP